MTTAALLARAVALIAAGLFLVAAGLTVPPTPPASDPSPGWRVATDAESREWQRQQLEDLIDAKRSMK
ncbi:hypothetical protein HCB17_10615 [Salinispora arenicola]|uniref:hypothetical protein n=1 Tax=Salinispora arenicola TaxID=168697 RepID=UPI00142FCA59|nr:hypothetical protein [Salinispora arenicola]NIL41576.1 hypothetical protein [Salinispora arenicola]